MNGIDRMVRVIGFFASARFHPVHLVNPVYILRIRSRRKSLDRMNRIHGMVGAKRSVRASLPSCSSC